ncbi:MAG: M14 family metallopeptidase [candidate division KSB1 bacterium]|nr:M14 family metallopeptidase [candidate division KSB1 bacterium]MDZ7391372.1 M14 family metallopeptidase [candidate division KSB1 bacterium]
MYARRLGVWGVIFGWVGLTGIVSGSEIAFDRYHSYDELTAALKKLAAEHKDLLRLESIGRSRQGRELWAARIAGPKGTDPDRRPAVLIVANLEGSHFIGTEMTLYTVHYLAGNYRANDTLRALLDSRTFYLLPCLNPDGMQALFAGPVWARTTNATPWDDDFDDVADEDGPEDLNGDGMITLMRVRAPDGDYLPDPKAPRLLKLAERAKGERGMYKCYPEGLDNDADEEYNEDGPGGVNLNMNFPHAYAEHAPGAGMHAVSEAESRALVEFVLAHRNIAVILTYGPYDNLLTPPQERAGGEREQEPEISQFAAGRRGFEFPSGVNREQMRRMFERKAPTAVLSQDVPFFQEVSRRYKEFVGIEEDRAKDKPKPRGAFYEWGYFQYGVPSFAAKVWTLPELREERTTGPREAGSDTTRRPGRGPEERRPGQGPPRGRDRSTEESDDVLWLKWLDKEQQGKGFVPWTSFRHPTLGEVEIGGFEPLLKVNPPAARIAEFGQKHARFAAYLAGLCPEITIAKTEVKGHGGGVFAIKVEVENKGFFPTALTQGVRCQGVRPTLIRLLLDKGELLTGSSLHRLPSLEGSGKRQRYEWLVKAAPGSKARVQVVSEKAGQTEQEITLR